MLDFDSLHGTARRRENAWRRQGGHLNEPANEGWVLGLGHRVLDLMLGAWGSKPPGSKSSEFLKS